MPATTHLEYRRKPSAVLISWRAVTRPSVRRLLAPVPPVVARWRDCRAVARDLARFRALTGLADGPALDLLYPQAMGFPLQIAVLSHPAYPLPLRDSLQIRNHLRLHRPLDPGEPLQLETRVAGQRALEKGLEVDLYTTLHARGDLVWEGLTTVYYRGRYGAPETSGAASPLAEPPPPPETERDAWRLPTDGKWSMVRLTADSNPLHYAPWYARRIGFRGATLHPQRVLGLCLARLPAGAPAYPQRLDAWLRGPLYYGAHVRLRGDPGGPDGSAQRFALVPQDDPRPAVFGRWSQGAAPPLLDAEGRVLGLDGG